MSRTLASPDCIARAAASMPVRRSLTSSATSRADFPASAASARTSSATTAKPSPRSSARAASIAALIAEVSGEPLRCLRQGFGGRVQLLRRRGQLLGKRGDLVRFALHRRNRRPDLFEHAVEALLEEAELVGLRGGRPHGEVALLR